VPKLPLGHAVQIRSVVAVPAAPTDSPAVQDVHGTHAVAALLSLSQVPLAQATFGEVPPAQYAPTSHASHTAAAVGVAGEVCTVPAGHASAGKQLVWFGDDVYVPPAHVAHWRSATAVPSALTWLPDSQILHGRQLAAFATTLKLPLAHDAHVRSEIAPPSLVTYCPALHAVHETHAVAALPSWSQVPLAHKIFGAALPAQYVPGSHGAHAGGAVSVAGVICAVPAAHSSAVTHVVWFGEEE